MRIFKYTLPVADGPIVLDMPNRARILSVQSQGPNAAPVMVTMWALVDESELIVGRTFRIFGTGQSLPSAVLGYVYIGTVQCAGGALVWHVFEVTP